MTIRTLRADARRNETVVLEGARRAFAASGLQASYREVARLAGVGVGTVYRRFPDRIALFEAVLIDVLERITDDAQIASRSEDSWSAFAAFFLNLSNYAARHAGLSEQMVGDGGKRVVAARKQLISAVQSLCERAKSGGLRDDIDGGDIIFLAQVTATSGCGLQVEMGADRRTHAIGIILDGLKRPHPEDAVSQSRGSASKRELARS